MAEALLMPKMSDTMEEGVIAEMNVKVGDTINSGDVIAEVETDKATMEWESYVDGVVLHLEAGTGDAVPVNGVVAILGKKGEDFASVLEEAKNAASSAPVEAAAEPVKEEAAPVEAPKPEPVKAAAPQAAPVSSNSNGRVKASPLAKKMAADKGIDLGAVNGSGDDGRIVKKDIESYQPGSSASGQAAVNISLPTVVAEESYEEVKVSQMRKTIARRLGESKFGAPHFYLTMEVTMDKTMEARKAINKTAPIKISFNDIIIKACAVGLRQHKAINASWLGDTIRYNNHVHIGMAVAVDEGLLVPVIKFADNKTLSHISAESKEYAGKAREKKLQPEEMSGNTFTISNLGMMGIEEFTAIINPPDVCILAVGGIKQVPTIVDGELKNKHVMKLTLSSDHRVVDGATGAKFLQTVKALIEDPVRMLV